MEGWMGRWSQWCGHVHLPWTVLPSPQTRHPCPPLHFWHFVFKPIIVCKLFSLKLMFHSSPLKQSPSWSRGKGISKRFFFFLSFPLQAQCWFVHITASK